MGKWKMDKATRAKFANPANTVSNVVANPKRGASQKRFALYAKLGKEFTVAKYIEAVEKSKLGNRTMAEADICWDQQHGYIKVNLAAKAGAKPTLPKLPEPKPAPEKARTAGEMAGEAEAAAGLPPA